ncbi:MAG: hypothetical protein IH984_15805 [Planctomycetes bacterium]|nr:hypothetical protein [Planctomycetota bacterium]
MAKKTKTAAAMMTILTLTAAVQAGSVLYVDDDAPADGDGASWKTAFRFLQDAIAEAAGGGIGELRIAQGTYRPDRSEKNPEGSGNRESSFQLNNGVALMGAYAGIGADDPDERDFELYETILSGDLLGDDGEDFQNNDENSLHVLIGLAESEVGLIEGFTISGGNANINSSSNRNGGGAYFVDVSPTFISCKFSFNFADSSGGAVYSVGEGNLYFENCIFSGNMATHGGAVYIFANNPDPKLASFLNCLFNNNTTTNLPFFSGSGGAIKIGYHVTATITKCSFLGNTAASGGASSITNNAVLLMFDCILQNNSALRGGALHSQSSTLTLSNCNLSDNTSETGGAVAIYSSAVLDAKDCLFVANVASEQGGAVYVRGGAVAMTDCLVVDNTAELFGGGVCIDDSDMQSTFVGCTIQSNSGDFGGGLFIREAEVTLYNSKILGNMAQTWGGGMYIALSEVDITNCILSGNLADNGGAMYNFQTSPILSNCTISANSASQNGGGVFNQLEAHPLITNCVLWGNTDSGPADESAQVFSLFASEPVVSYSCIEGLTGKLGGIGNIGDDPLFVDSKNDDYRLSAESPAIDSGINNAVPSDVVDLDDDNDTAEFTPIDLDGNPRFSDAPKTPDSGCGVPVIVDMGAYEFAGDAIQPVRGDIDGDLIVSTIDLLALFSSWGQCESCCLADLDNDGTVGTADILILLSNWG